MSNKPKLQPPKQPRTFASDPNASRFKFIALIGFVILMMGAFVVVIILPSQLAKRRDNTHVVPEAPSVQSQVAEEPTSKAEEAPGKSGNQKKIEAQELLQQVLKHQARLENEAVKTWGAESLVTSYGQVIASLAKANADFDHKLFDQAAEGYAETISMLEQLASSRPERIQRSIQAGDEALSQLDSQLAKHHYEIALSADPFNNEAQAGLERSENLPKVLECIAQAQNHESKGELDLARRMYNSAMSLDMDYQPARKHRQRIDELILERDFGRAMSNAISALNQKEIWQAKQALDIARKLRPDVAEVRDLEQQLKNAEQLAELQRLGKQAQQYEQAEQWEKALNAYSMALKIEANAGFAQQGKLRTERLLDLSRQIQNYLLNPDELQSLDHTNHARKLYEMAVAKSDAGPKFRDKTEKLGELLEAYNKPIPVLLQSDDMTDVQVYRVGWFGRLLKHRLMLRPGRYKALGTRSGYRDVSIWFTVPVGSEEITIAVYCKEKI